jgi:glycosyltransferase involved in cell wall biosynthesis
MMDRLTIWLPLIRTGTGAEVWTRRLASGLAARGHRAVLTEAAHAFQYAPWLAPMRMPPGTDVIVANSWNAAVFARRDVPLVPVFHLATHDPAFQPFKSTAQAAFHRRFVLPMERAGLRRAARAVSVSPRTMDSVRSTVGEAAHVAVLNGIDTGFFTPGPDRSAPSVPFRLLFAGTPSRRKGFDVVAESLRLLGNAAELTVAGGLPKPGLPEPPARYVGRLDRATLRDAYRAADLLFFPSRLEGFGLVAAEAMACGLPVICTEGTAVAEIVPIPEAGLACAPGDAAAFAAAIRGLAADPARLAGMRAAARAHAVAHLDEARWIAEMEAVLYDAASAARSQR